MRRASRAVLLILFAVTAGPVSAAPEREATAMDAFLKDVRKTTLPNGLTVITREAPGTGVVAINTWVKAGYFNEPDEVAGMAHLFEHMFFKGSQKFPGAEQIAEELASIGGRTNAGTIYDSTNYYFVVPKQSFSRAVEIQADAVIHPLFDAAELKKESEVVIEESNRKLDNPPAVSWERMAAVMFTEHRMKRWRIGSNDVLRNIDRDDLLAFFQTLYRPENMILSIAGDVTHAEALRVATETFGTLPRGRLDKKRGPREPEQTQFRFGASAADLNQGYSVLGWHTPGVGSSDEIALDVLASILGRGRSSRLFRYVVGPDAAATAEASHETFDDVGVFSVQASFDEARRAEVDRRVLAEVARLRAHGPTAYELQLSKNAIESSLAFELETPLGQAQTLAQLEARYGYAALPDRLSELHALTADDVRAAAAKYLRNENLTLYHYQPSGAAPTTREQTWALVEQATATPPEAVADVPLPAPSRPPASAAAETAPREIALDNGMTLVVQQRPGAPVVSTAIYFPGGRLDESSRNAGITQLTARAMRKGTTTRSGEQIDRELEFLGTQLGIDVNADRFGLSIDTLRSAQRDGLAVLADVVLHPTFPEAGVEEERFQQAAAIKRSFDSSTQRPFQLALEALYGSHPYGLPANGDETSLASLDRSSLVAWWQAHVVSDGALVVVVGDVAAGDAQALVESAFAALPRRQAPRAVVAEPSLPPSRLEVVEYRDRKQSAIVYAFPTVTRSSDDFPKVRLLGNVASGLAGTFFAELRGRRSLAYTVFAFQLTGDEAGAFVAYLASEASKEPAAREALLAEIRKLGTDGFTDKDFARAKSYFAGSTRINLQTNSAQAADLVTNWFAGVGLDYTDRLIETTNALTIEEVREAARRYLSTDRFVEAIQRGQS